jgi:hypothetical protein
VQAKRFPFDDLLFNRSKNQAADNIKEIDEIYIKQKSE